MNYRKIYEEAYGKIPTGYDIHHKDGNRNNNDLSNLVALSLEDHLKIHIMQQDWGAAQAILIRMNTDRDSVIQAASKAQKDRLKAGTHNFQKMTKERRSEISKNAANKTVVNKVGIHAINADPTLAKANASKAGKISRDKKAGFHGDPLKSGGNFVKNTKWWINTQTGVRKRSQHSPGIEWKQGIKI